MPGAKADLVPFDVYSAIALGRGASGMQSFFIAALGQPIPKMGALRTGETHLRQHDLHSTNLTRPGELGRGYVNAEIQRLRFEIAPTIPEDVKQQFREKCYWQLLIGSRLQAQAPFALKPWLPGVDDGLCELDRPVPYCRHDLLEVRFGVAHGATLKLARDRLLLCVLSGRATLDVDVR